MTLLHQCIQSGAKQLTIMEKKYFAPKSKNKESFGTTISTVN